MIYSYNAFGCRITSDIVLPRLNRKGRGVSPLNVRTGPFSEEMEKETKCGVRFRGKVRGVGRFFFDQGENITVERDENASELLMELTILGTIVSIALRQKGWMALHASGVVIDGAAHLFVGDSGAGKSTIAHALCDVPGVALLTDDVGAIEFVDGIPLVHSAYPSVRLSRHVVDSATARTGTLSEREKLWLPMEDRFAYGTFPLAAIHVLEYGDAVSVRRDRGPEAIGQLIPHARGVPPLSDEGILVQQFEQLSAFVKLGCVARLTRRRDPELLSDSVNAVVNYASAVSSTHQLA